MAGWQDERAKPGCKDALGIGFEPAFPRGGGERDLAFDALSRLAQRVPDRFGVEPRHGRHSPGQRRECDFPLRAALAKTEEKSADIHPVKLRDSFFVQVERCYSEMCKDRSKPAFRRPRFYTRDKLYLSEA